MREALRVWTYIAVHSFGGPAGQIAVMHRVLVEEKRWLSERRFLHALNYCMLLPGPEAMQLATYTGWLMHGVRGGLLAGCLFVLPGFLSILALSLAYAAYADTSWLPAVFFGLKAAVLALVLEALLRIGKRTLHGGFLVALAAVAFLAIFAFGVPFPLIVLVAGLTAWQVGRRWPHAVTSRRPDSAEDAPTDSTPPSAASTVRTLATWLLVWWLPVAAIAAVLGIRHVLTQQAWFFSKAAVVTFGGAYAVLAYIAQQAVEAYGWLRPGEMLDGLGMAETTPGPLIQVVQFVGFLGAFRDAAPFTPMVAGIVASVVVTWVTFVPSFLFVFTGAPYVERLRQNAGLAHALTGITAAVVGVVLNLAVWFGIHVLWPGAEERALGPLQWLAPVGRPDLLAVAIALGSFMALWRLRWNVFVVLLAAVMVGLARA